MAKPVILTVDDDPNVRRALERDLRRQYGQDYRIVAADSGLSALESLSKLQLRNEAVALLLVDERMPHMSGVDFLQQAIPMFGDSKRVLLTAYADTEAAISAINTARIDYFLLKPWDPPEEKLYPVISDVLDDWRANYRPRWDGPRVIGHRWSAKSHDLRDFLGRNQVPYQWLDFEANEEARKLIEYSGATSSHLPLVLLPDGSALAEPSTAELAERLGLATRAKGEFYDLVIVGGGPAGLAAAVYGASEGLKTVMVESSAPGGQAGTSSRIENYLGFPAGLSGADLARRGVTQARRFGVEILAPQAVSSIRTADPYRIATLGDGSEISCHALLVATGVEYRKLPVPGIDELTGAGVYYGAAMTEAFNCRDEDVYIVGGANSAGQAAMYFSRFARGVTLVVRGTSLDKSMSRYLIDELAGQPNVSIRADTNVVEVSGDGRLEHIAIRNSVSGDDEIVSAAALFIFIGALPCTDWLGSCVARTPDGFVLTGRDMLIDGKMPATWPLERDPFLLETSLPGIFAAGDVRCGSTKRVASSVGEGAMAVMFIHQYLSKV